jgi:hypothetical protein
MTALVDHVTIYNVRTKADQEVFMSYGLLNEMTKLFGGNINTLPTLDLDPSIAEPIMAMLLAERDETGKIISNPIFDISISDAEKVFDWVKEHLVNFFIGRLSSTKMVFTRHAETLTALGLSLNGTQDDPSKTA